MNFAPGTNTSTHRSCCCSSKPLFPILGLSHCCLLQPSCWSCTAVISAILLVSFPLAHWRGPASLKLFRHNGFIWLNGNDLCCLLPALCLYQWRQTLKWPEELLEKGYVLLMTMTVMLLSVGTYSSLQSRCIISISTIAATAAGL